MSLKHNRIAVSHVGALPRPAGLPGLFPQSDDTPLTTVEKAIDDVVARQVATGVDIVNDGEFSKLGFIHYIADRLTGMEKRSSREDEGDLGEIVAKRDLMAFPRYYGDRGGVFPFKVPVVECVSPLGFRGREAVEADCRNLKSAMKKHGAEQGFLTGISPLTVALLVPNLHYASDEDYLAAAADALYDEFKAITDSGLMVQVDDPGLAHAWQKYPDWTVADCRRYCETGIEAINHALRDCPPEQVRFHVCWGSFHGPHATDLELKHFIDLLYKVNAGCYSIEGANPRHEHEWTVFRDNPLLDGKSIMAGVVAHVADTVEHPELVAQRLERWADVLGRENVIAGTDCGMMRVHHEICWAKMQAMAEGTRIASERLWS